MKEDKIVHLGDGAYVTISPYEILLTANHHHPASATDKVSLDHKSFDKLAELVKEYRQVGD